jgi:enoyl-[acyl-carrier protein] reductase II
MDSAFPDNPVCRRFGISAPLVQAGMVWCAGWELAAAVSNAGGLGLIGAGSMDPETLRLHIRKAQAATTLPFGVNVPLLYRHAEDLLRVIQEEGVKIVFSSAGNPKTFTPTLKAAGITVAHVVANVRFACKAEEAGCDAVVAEGFEAGGHNGKDELTTLVLIPQVRAATTLPLIAAGGIASGAAMLAALAIGADGVQIGTRFVASQESSAHTHYKEKIVATPDDGTMLAMKAVTPVRLIRNAFYDRIAAAEARGASRDELLGILGRGRARQGMFEGDMEEGELEIGQIAGAVKAILPAADIVREILADYQAARRAVAGHAPRFGNQL